MEEVKEFMEKNNEQEPLSKRVNDLLDKNPSVDLKKLVEYFPKANRLTLGKYKSIWKWKPKGKKSKNSSLTEPVKEEISKKEINNKKENTNIIMDSIEILRKYIKKIDPELLDYLDLFRNLHKFREKIS